MGYFKHMRTTIIRNFILITSLLSDNLFAGLELIHNSKRSQKTRVPDQTLPAHACTKMCMQPIVFKDKEHISSFPYIFKATGREKKMFEFSCGMLSDVLIIKKLLLVGNYYIAKCLFYMTSWRHKGTMLRKQVLVRHFLKLGICAIR